MLTRWEEWLGLEIHPDTLNNFDFIDIIVHCLWEMTFHGYNQFQIQKERRSQEKDKKIKRI
ncbi:MAG: DUF6557 family protein [Promethearchaeota archaeon]